MWWNSGKKAQREAIAFLYEDTAKTISALSYYAPAAVQKAVARVVMEKVFAFSYFSMANPASAGDVLKSALQKVTLERQVAVQKAAKSPHPGADEDWAKAALFEGVLQTLLLAQDPADKKRMNDLVRQWAELVLGVDEVNKLASKVKASMIG